MNSEDVLASSDGADRIPAAAQAERFAISDWLSLAAIACAIWLVYGRALDAPLIFDDKNSVETNISILHLWPLWGADGLPGPLNPPRDYCTAGRPVVNFTLALNYRFGQRDPWGYHVVNVLLHTLSAWLVFAIVRRTLKLDYLAGRFTDVATSLALVVALVWAIHPLASEAVIYITQRTELLVSLFYLATLYASLRYFAATSPAQHAAWLTAASIACLLGMGSKEVMVSAPLLVLLYERTFIAGSFRQALRRSWPLYAGLAVGWALLGALNYDSPRGSSAGFHLGLPAQMWWYTQAKVLALYLKLVVWPWPLSIHYEIPYLQTLAVAWPWVALAGLLIAVTLWLVVRRSAAGFVGAWVFAILAPTLVVPVVTEVAVERRMYLPLVALVALIVIGGYDLARAVFAGRESLPAQQLPRPTWIVGLGCVAALLLALLTIRRLSAYESSLALWQDAVSHNADDYLAQNNLGFALLAAGRVQDAIPHFERSARLKPDYTPAFINQGVAWMRVQQPQRALPVFQQALKLEPNNAEAHCNVGLLLYGAGRVNDALAEFAEAVRLNPLLPQAQNNLGVALSATGRTGEAIPHFEQALRLQPSNAEACASLAMAYAKLNRPREALEWGTKGLDLARAQGQQALQAQISAWLDNYRQTSQ